ncbi:MAG: alanine--tRNA ligase [Tenericutes bacterium]|jgi:alanyl-tRNA synthetase|nr:alanine--tRNA ligase [Mycoplasmatota bacterium]
MKNLKGHEIRKIWLNFFSDKGHRIEESASLIPNNDPTLLWMNSGVAALKQYFDGRVVPKNPCIVNVQKCIRTNDIENVGNTARHHTFFEMLGNFSIGDYFRDDAIDYAYEILSSPKYFDMPLDKLYFTYYPTDNETYDKWLDKGIKPENLIPSENNFWEIGTGPCGPCTEVFYDRGPDFGDHTTESIKKDIENDRYVELWNIVLSQYNAKDDLAREEYPELPSKNIDTGGGLERFASVFQNAKTNFETDLFLPIINRFGEIAQIEYTGQKSFKIVADHIRTITMALNDGAMISNEGRGYVIRRLLRRAVKHGKQNGIDKPFLSDLVTVVIELMKPFYPGLEEKASIIKKIIHNEEVKFLETLNSGEEKLLEIIKRSDNKLISGENAFLLYDTYGFPLELTEEYAEEKGFKVDIAGFKQEMEKQKERARNARTDTSSLTSQNSEYLEFKETSEFVGYDRLDEMTEVIKVFPEGIVLRKTPFYATSGGQIADKGVIYNDDYHLHVIDVNKLPNGQFLHSIKEDIPENLEGQTVRASVDQENREFTEYHHSATHLLFKVLRDTLGKHVSQQGSQVTSTSLRFDFNHFENLTDEEIIKIEELVNDMIQEEYFTSTSILSVDEAKEKGAIAEFGEKYSDKVRTVDLKYTLDLCGGTHVKDVSDIERFAIKAVYSIGSGIYRIEGLANDRVDDLLSELTGLNEDIENLRRKARKIIEQAKNEKMDLTIDFKEDYKPVGSYKDVIHQRELLKDLQQSVKSLEKEFNQLKETQSLNKVGDFSKDTYDNKIISLVKGVNASVLKQLADDLIQTLDNGFILLATIQNKKVIFIAKSNDETLDAGKIVREAAKICDGSGGGRKDFAQAGGKDTSKINDALEKVKELVL